MEILSNKGKRCFCMKIINLEAIGKTRKVTNIGDGCKARLTTSNDSELIEFISSHTHVGDTVQNESVQTLRTAYKRKATETVGERPSKVIKTCLKEHGESDVTSSDVNNVRAAMYRERRKHCGVLPRNVDEIRHITLKQLPMLTNRREDFLCRCETTDNGRGFVVFTTRFSLETLCNADVITMDGTFRVCPKFFHQLYTVRGYVNGHYIPLIIFIHQHKR